jgi:hypothetical protein
LDLFQLSDVNYFKNRFKSSNKEIQNENKHNTNINININDDDDDWDYFEVLLLKKIFSLKIILI